MHYYKTIIQYDGTNFAGFQWQKNLSTIQSELNNSIEKILDGKFSTVAASRTDTGVHAKEQILKITSKNLIELSSFTEELNLKLPKEIRCLQIENCQGNFKPTANTISKEYRYLFINSKNKNHFIANIANPLNIESINKCVQILVGQHDFQNFYSSGSNVKSTTREIFLCELNIINPKDIFSENDLFQFPTEIQTCFELKIIANGFLKQMIRHIISALWMVGSGKISIEEFKLLLNGPKNKKKIWKVAPSNGLFLYKINYLNSYLKG